MDTMAKITGSPKPSCSGSVEGLGTFKDWKVSGIEEVDDWLEMLKRKPFAYLLGKRRGIISWYTPTVNVSGSCIDITIEGTRLVEERFIVMDFVISPASESVP